MLCRPVAPASDRRRQRRELGARERPHDGLSGDLPPVRACRPVHHDQVGLVERAGVAEAEHPAVDAAVVDDPAAAQRAVADQDGQPVESVVDHLVEVQDLERVGIGLVTGLVPEHQVVGLQPVAGRGVAVGGQRRWVGSRRAVGSGAQGWRPAGGWIHRRRCRTRSGRGARCVCSGRRREVVRGPAVARPRPAPRSRHRSIPRTMPPRDRSRSARRRDGRWPYRSNPAGPDTLPLPAVPFRDMTRPYLTSKLAGFGTTIFAEMSELAARHDAINLGQGFPDEDGPTAGAGGGRRRHPFGPQPVSTGPRVCPSCGRPSPATSTGSGGSSWTPTPRSWSPPEPPRRWPAPCWACWTPATK